MCKSFLNSCRNNIERGLVSAAVDDDIGIFFGGLYVNAVHDFNGAYVLIDNAVNISASLGYVAAQAAQDALVGIGIRKNLDVKKLAESLVVKGQNAIHNNDRCGANANRFAFASVNTKIIIGNIHALAAHQFTQMLDKQIGIQRIGAVVVCLYALFHRKMVLRLIIIVIRNNRYFIGEELF